MRSALLCAVFSACAVVAVVAVLGASALELELELEWGELLLYGLVDLGFAVSRRIRAFREAVVKACRRGGEWVAVSRKAAARDSRRGRMVNNSCLLCLGGSCMYVQNQYIEMREGCRIDHRGGV
jgi:hypothetical protein